VIKEVKREFREWRLVRRRALGTKLGNAYENVVSDPKDVCEEIKNTLRDEIAETYFCNGHREVLSTKMEEEYKA
jgi:hypothetical protein